MAMTKKANAGEAVDCIFFDKRCTILKVQCNKHREKPGGCSFQKSAAEQKDSRKKHSARLASLPERRQFEISWQYYDGQRPWLCEED